MRVLQVMARSYIAPDDMDAAVKFYEHLLGEECQVRFPIEEIGIEIAAVGDIHLVSGSEARLAHFRDVRAAFFVDSVSEYETELSRLGAAVMQEPRQGPFGLFMIVRHPDGLIVEYADRSVPD